MIDTTQDLLNFLYEKGKRKGIVSIEITASAKDAAVLMAENKINFLAVTKGGKYVGVLSTSDTSSEMGSSLRPSERTVSDIMKVGVITVSVTDTLTKISESLSLHRIRHLVVVDGRRRWVAILDSNEVLNGVMQNLAEEEQMRAQAEGEFRRRD